MLVPTGSVCPLHPPADRLRDRRGETARGSSTARGYGVGWRAVSARQLARYPECSWCGSPATVADHVVAKRLGGTDDPANLQSLCSVCHAVKTGRERVWANRRRPT